MEMESGTAFTTKIFKNESRAYFWGGASKNQNPPFYKPPQKTRKKKPKTTESYFSKRFSPICADSLQQLSCVFLLSCFVWAVRFSINFRIHY